MASGSVDESRHLLKQLSHQSSSESCVGEEMDLLSNVYFDDLQISHTDRGHSLTLHITPCTAEDKEKQFVYLDLNVVLSSKYPHSVPEVSLGRSRGLSDAHLRGISEGLSLKCEELVGTPMVYELVEYARECLTDNNLPCSQCSVCQVPFQEGDDFTKTECYHYLHVVCLARYVEFFEKERREMEREEALVDAMLRKKPKQLECPVCREPIPLGSPCLEAIYRIQPDNLREEDDVQFTPSAELKAWQVRMASLLWQQKQKGGVIDPNSEDDVIDETWVSSVPRKGERELDEKEITLVKEKEDQRKYKTTADDQTTVSKRVCDQQRRERGHRMSRAETPKNIIDKGGDSHKDDGKVRENTRRVGKQERGKEQRRYDQDQGRGARESGRGRWRGRGGGRSDGERSRGNRNVQDYVTGQSSRSRPVYRGRGGGRKAESAKKQSAHTQKDSELSTASLPSVKIMADGESSSRQSPGSRVMADGEDRNGQRSTRPSPHEAS